MGGEKSDILFYVSIAEIEEVNILIMPMYIVKRTESKDTNLPNSQRDGWGGGDHHVYLDAALKTRNFSIASRKVISKILGDHSDRLARDLAVLRMQNGS